jgi:hypothetical protein
MTPGLIEISRRMVGEILPKFPSYKTSRVGSRIEEIVAIVDGFEIH